MKAPGYLSVCEQEFAGIKREAGEMEGGRIMYVL